MSLCVVFFCAMALAGGLDVWVLMRGARVVVEYRMPRYASDFVPRDLPAYVQRPEASGDCPSDPRLADAFARRTYLQALKHLKDAAPVTHRCACARRHVGVHAPGVCVARHGSASKPAS